jgi:flagellin-like protein
MKGITPVIAVILMLALTVAAAGLLWTQFQDLAGSAQSEAGFLNNADIKMVNARRNDSGSTDMIEINMENTGEQQYNLSETAKLQYEIPGEDKVSPFNPLFGEYEYNQTNQTCFDDGTGLQTFGPGDTAGCNTGIEMPSPSDDPITIHLVQAGSDSSTSIAEITCSPSTSDSYTC